MNPWTVQSRGLALQGGQESPSLESLNREGSGKEVSSCPASSLCRLGLGLLISAILGLELMPLPPWLAGLKPGRSCAMDLLGLQLAKGRLQNFSASWIEGQLLVVLSHLLEDEGCGCGLHVASVTRAMGSGADS